MFNRSRICGLIILAIVVNIANAYAVSVADASANAANLSLNVATKNAAQATVNKDANALVSPSQAKAIPSLSEKQPTVGAQVNTNEKSMDTKTTSAGMQTQSAGNVGGTPEQQKNINAGANTGASANVSVSTPQMQEAAPQKDDFNFDLKMKSLNVPAQQPAASVAAAASSASGPSPTVNDVDLPKDIQYKANPVESLGNSILSQMDSDLFSQMSEIEKSTTLLTLELRREKIRNEIEAQKAIRQKNLDEQERLKEEQKLKDLERKKKIEAQVLQEKQALLDKEQVFEVLKQRKLLNAYMNQMLVNQQEWLKEKESLYAQIAALEGEKKELIELFKERINKVLEASAKNIQVAEAARANFERIVKNLKARNEQLRKRVEADAQIIKNAKNNLYLKSQSIEELKDKNASAAAISAANATAASQIDNVEDVVEEEKAPEKLSSQYAILGISGRANDMSVDVIDINGQPMSLKIGSPLPTGHILSEIGADYAKFSRDGADDYLYVGKSIDGYVPTLGLTDEKKK